MFRLIKFNSSIPPPSPARVGRPRRVVLSDRQKVQLTRYYYHQPAMINQHRDLREVGYEYDQCLMSKETSE